MHFRIVYNTEMLCIDLQCTARQWGPYKNWYILCSTPSTGLLSRPYYLLLHTLVLVKISGQLMLWNIQKSKCLYTASQPVRNSFCHTVNVPFLLVTFAGYFWLVTWEMAAHPSLEAPSAGVLARLYVYSLFKYATGLI